MTPIEKAKELFDNYCYAIRTEVTDSGYFTNVIYAKQCALIAVDEILNETKDTVWVGNAEGTEREIVEVVYDPYWLEVKQEIEKL